MTEDELIKAKKSEAARELRSILSDARAKASAENGRKYGGRPRIYPPCKSPEPPAPKPEEFYQAPSPVLPGEIVIIDGVMYRR